VKPQPLPLAGIKVVEFSHMVMGPSCGLILADLGADVVKVEPVPAGDNTRRLPGSGAGFFATFNRNKRSLALDLKTPEGIELAKKLIQEADVVTENFRPGGIDALGLGYDALKTTNPSLIYCSLKGFLSGPYEQRAALDEVVQMMGGLAYMTGPPGRPLRAGASVNDIMGGMFAAIGILAALNERTRTGQGQLVKSALFENNMFLVAQHMIQFAVTGKPASPMPNGSPPGPSTTSSRPATGSRCSLASSAIPSGGPSAMPSVLRTCSPTRRCQAIRNGWTRVNGSCRCCGTCSRHSHGRKSRRSANRRACHSPRSRDLRKCSKIRISDLQGP